MNYHSNTPANRAAVNQENLIQQVAVKLAHVIFELGQLVTSPGVNAPRLQLLARELALEKIRQSIQTYARTC